MKQPKNVNRVGRLSSLWKVKVKVKLTSLSLIRLFVTPWTVAHQDPLSMGYSRQVYWSGLLFPSPGDLPDPGIEPRSPTLQADTLTSEPPGKLGSVEAQHKFSCEGACSWKTLRALKVRQ